VVFEGDQALQIQPTTAPNRAIAEPMTGLFSIEQYVRFEPGARLVAYTEVEATGELIANHGAVWAAFPDGRFYVVAGTGDGCIVCHTEFTGFTWSPGVWYQVTTVIDVAAQSWDFYVDGAHYDRADPLGFRGTPAYLDRIRYLSEGSASVFLDAIIIRNLQTNIVAETGFNDLKGIGSEMPGAYVLGPLTADSGQGEPGWLRTWGPDPRSIVQNKVVFEGDQALQIQPTTAPNRAIAEPMTGLFSIEQYVRFEPGARLVAYTEVEATGELIANQGAVWQALPDGRFYVVAGTGDGCIVCNTEFTGFTWSPGIWYQVTTVIDVSAQSWDFYVDGAHYDRAEPLGFRGTPTSLDRIRYLSEGSGSVFLDAIIIRREE
jgi:hypothetical protein